jgi:hypothetical protein
MASYTNAKSKLRTDEATHVLQNPYWIQSSEIDLAEDLSTYGSAAVLFTLDISKGNRLILHDFYSNVVVAAASYNSGSTQGTIAFGLGTIDAKATLLSAGKATVTTVGAAFVTLTASAGVIAVGLTGKTHDAVSTAGMTPNAFKGLILSDGVASSASHNCYVIYAKKANGGSGTGKLRAHLLVSKLPSI